MTRNIAKTMNVFERQFGVLSINNGQERGELSGILNGKGYKKSGGDFFSKFKFPEEPFLKLEICLL